MTTENRLKGSNLTIKAEFDKILVGSKQTVAIESDWVVLTLGLEPN